MKTKTEIDLKPFCDPHQTRFAIGKPWVDRGWRYATDGRVLVRVPTDEPDTRDGLKRPRAAELLKPIEGDYLPWPEVEGCDECNRTGKVKCSGCKCGNCQEMGCGSVLCICTHKGSFSHRFGAASLSRHYAHLVSKLPSVQYLPSVKHTDPVRFMFDGGQGAVMGMRDV